MNADYDMSVDDMSIYLLLPLFSTIFLLHNKGGGNLLSSSSQDDEERGGVVQTECLDGVAMVLLDFYSNADDRHERDGMVTSSQIIFFRGNQRNARELTEKPAETTHTPHRSKSFT